MGRHLLTINGSDFTSMVLNGAEILRARADQVNALNVFPVPDGDTGTNMSLTMDAGAAELRQKSSSHIGEAAETLSKGLLLGARGNSGVILSQLFRGFALFVHDMEEISVIQFAAALQSGVDTAYKAVLKPVEGTILTVAREAAGHAVSHARKYGDAAALLHDVWRKADEALAKTPDQLPILKQVGVVDSGGQGLVFIYEGFLAALTEQHDLLENSVAPNVALPDVQHAPKQPLHTPAVHRDAIAQVMGAKESEKLSSQIAQAKLATEEITHPYDMEFFIRLAGDTTDYAVFDEAHFQAELEHLGDSVIVIADPEMVKVHIHSSLPGNVLNVSIRYGELSDIRILNMRDQHRELLGTQVGSSSTKEVSSDNATIKQVSNESTTAPKVYGAASAAWSPIGTKMYGIVAVASGEGLHRIFRSLGVDRVLSGGLTMNPSTEEIVDAIRETGSQTVYVLPNNSNIILAAQQAKQIVTELTVEIIPAKTIPQGLAAALVFDASASSDQNIRTMTKAIATVRSGQVTHAVRDSQMDGIDIREGDYLGILDNRIVASDRDLLQTCTSMLTAMIGDHTDIFTIYTGADADEPTTGRLLAALKQKHPRLDVELHEGGQPVYTYLFSAE